MAILENIKRQIDHFVKPSLEEAEATSQFNSNISRQATSSPLNPPSKALKDAFLPARSSTEQSFDETYKAAYSHGLENIYALENVDLKSIRRIEEPKRNAAFSQLKPECLFIAPGLENQLEFDFGDDFCGCMESFLVREPIHVLGLSRHAERCLLEHDKHVLRDLLHTDLREFVFFKGMGQGHIDEIQQKLKSYLDGRALQNCRQVDFCAWIRSLMADADRKKAYVCLELYQLADLLSLSPAENVEVRCLTLEKKQEWIEAALAQFRSEKYRQVVSIDMNRIVNIFVKPWMRQRFGFATQHELLERLEKISENSQVTSLAFNFFSEVYFDRVSPLNYFLYQVDEELYCADESSARQYRLIVERAHSYFYKSQISYTLPQLVNLLAREFAKDWQGFAQGFLEKVLRQSSRFRTRRAASGQLIIRLA